MMPVHAAPPGGVGPCGGIGRRARLKIEFRKECWFDSGQGHHFVVIGLHSEPLCPQCRHHVVTGRGGSNLTAIDSTAVLTASTTFLRAA